MAEPQPKPKYRRVKTPTVLQMEAVECGAASLAMVLGYYGRRVTLEELRVACGISRDGSQALNIVRAARQYGLTAGGRRADPEQLREYTLPLIVFWGFNHFLVVEGFGKGKVYLNDPASGPRTVSDEEFSESYTGIALVFEPGPDFRKGGSYGSLTEELSRRLQGSRPALSYILLAGLALVVPGLALPAFTKVFVDEILVGRNEGWIWPIVVAMLFLALLAGALTWVQQYYLLRFSNKLSLTTSSQFLWHLFRLPVVFFLERFAGEVVGRVQSNDDVAQLLTGQLATTVIQALVIVFYAVVMFQYDVVLTSVGILIVLLNFLALRYFSRLRVDGNKRYLQEETKVTGNSIAGLQMIETLKAVGGETDFFARLTGFQTKAIAAQQELGVYTQYLSVIPPLLSSLTITAILTVGGLRVINGDITIGTLVAFQVLMLAFVQPINSLVSLGSTLQDIEGEMNRLDDVLQAELDPSVTGSADPTHTVDSGAKLMGYVEFREVTFGYSPQAPPLIENFNLKLAPGDRVALVGATGSGKSTTSNLLAGLYRPWSGEILLDGKPRSEIPRRLITNSLSMVTQEIFLFEGTVRDNLTMWDPTIPEADVLQAARDAGIHDVIASRPGGYLSPVEEGGRNFSGGQRQRLEIARTLAINPSILILDEATSALDPPTEKEIDDNLRRRGCTCLIVAHRLSTIRDCDQIIVLDQGKVVQRGTHDELKDAEGPYARLIRAE